VKRCSVVAGGLSPQNHASQFMVRESQRIKFQAEIKFEFDTVDKIDVAHK